MFKGKTGALPQPFHSMDNKELRIHGGISDQTLRHRIREMQILSGQEDAAVKGDEYYEDILSRMTDRENMNVGDLRKTARAYYALQEMPVEQAAELASEAFTDGNREIGQHYQDKNVERQNKYAQDMKQKVTKDKIDIAQQVSDYAKHFGKNGDLAAGRHKAIAHVARKLNKTEAEIRKLLGEKK